MPYPVRAGGQYPYGPEVQFRTLDVLPPAAVYVGPDDEIVIEARSPSVTTALTVAYRLLTPQGEIKYGLLTPSISTVGTAVQDVVVPPAEGYLISVHLNANSASRGQCFCKMFLRRTGAAGGGPLGHLLVQGYVSLDDHLGYPQSPTESSLNGRGWTHTATFADPGAGANFFTTVPAGVRWKIQTVIATLVTNATPGNRFAGLVALSPAAQTEFNIQTPAAIPASTTAFLSWAPGFPELNINNQWTAPSVIDLILVAGSQVSIQVTALQGTDQISSVRLTLEEWVAQ